jgi:hypothetical protein
VSRKWQLLTAERDVAEAYSHWLHGTRPLRQLGSYYVLHEAPTRRDLQTVRERVIGLWAIKTASRDEYGRPTWQSPSLWERQEPTGGRQ